MIARFFMSNGQIFDTDTDPGVFELDVQVREVETAIAEQLAGITYTKKGKRRKVMQPPACVTVTMPADSTGRVTRQILMTAHIIRVQVTED